MADNNYQNFVKILISYEKGINDEKEYTNIRSLSSKLLKAKEKGKDKISKKVLILREKKKYNTRQKIRVTDG